MMQFPAMDGVEPMRKNLVTTVLGKGRLQNDTAICHIVACCDNAASAKAPGRSFVLFFLLPESAFTALRKFLSVCIDAT